jgi:hypothetical protein
MKRSAHGMNLPRFMFMMQHTVKMWNDQKEAKARKAHSHHFKFSDLHSI